MSVRIAAAYLILSSFIGCTKNESSKAEVQRIAFGSCAYQTAPSGIYNYIVGKKPDLYLALGDNIYADDGPEVRDFEKHINFMYSLLESNGNFRDLANNMPILATWDDHDFGLNNSGAEFDKKDISKEAFLEFFDVPGDDPRRTREGIYHSAYYGDDQHRVQVIMLDTRWFKTHITSGEPLLPSYDAGKTVLGDAQWQWLEEELSKPAVVRIIGTSTQFSTEHNGWEAWANFPLEQEKMYDIIRRTHAEGVVFLSGDVHYAEFNKRTPGGLYPMYDCTSSGLTHAHDPAASSIYRLGDAYTNLNFGILDINWESSPVELGFKIFNKTGGLVREWEVSLEELTIP